MWRTVSSITIWAGVCRLAASPLAAAEPAAPPEDAQLRYEQIELANRSRYAGLIESEDNDWLTLIRIQSPRGQKMHLVIQPFDRRQVVSIERLDAARRAALQRRINEFRNRATIEAASLQAVQLAEAEGEGLSYRHYKSKWFTLDSTADEQSTRRVVVRAEQIFAAYRQILPPRNSPAQPPRLVVLSSMSQYQALLGRLGVRMNLQNPACYVENRNVVVIGSDLARLTAATRQISAQDDQLRKDLRDLEDRLPERLKSVGNSLRASGMSNGDIARELVRERRQFQRQVDKKREEVRQSDHQMDALFKQSASQTLAKLYHEAFHAYLRNWVYPSQKFDVPLWLNEGLAVIFEGGVLEGNTLRVDAPNAPVLKKLKADLTSPRPLGLDDLLSAGQAQYLLESGMRAAIVDRYYVHAWGLAYYLTFEKRLLGSPELDEYLRLESARLAPAARFERLVGMPRAQFDAQWQAYIEGL